MLKGSANNVKCDCARRSNLYQIRTCRNIDISIYVYVYRIDLLSIVSGIIIV